MNCHSSPESCTVRHETTSDIFSVPGPLAHVKNQGRLRAIQQTLGDSIGEFHPDAVRLACDGLYHLSPALVPEVRRLAERLVELGLPPHKLGRGRVFYTLMQEIRNSV